MAKHGGQKADRKAQIRRQQLSRDFRQPGDASENARVVGNVGRLARDAKGRRRGKRKRQKKRKRGRRDKRRKHMRLVETGEYDNRARASRTRKWKKKRNPFFFFSSKSYEPAELNDVSHQSSQTLEEPMNRRHNRVRLAPMRCRHMPFYRPRGTVSGVESGRGLVQARTGEAKPKITGEKRWKKKS